MTPHQPINISRVVFDDLRVSYHEAAGKCPSDPPSKGKYYTEIVELGLAAKAAGETLESLRRTKKALGL